MLLLHHSSDHRVVIWWGDAVSIPTGMIVSDGSIHNAALVDYSLLVLLLKLSIGVVGILVRNKLHAIRREGQLPVFANAGEWKLDGTDANRDALTWSQGE